MTSCKSVVHGDSTSIGLMSPAYLPGRRAHRRAVRPGRGHQHPGQISGAGSIVRTPEEPAQRRGRGQAGQGHRVRGLLGAGARHHRCGRHRGAGATTCRTSGIDKMMAVIGDDPVLWVNVKTAGDRATRANPNMQVFDQHLEAAEARYRTCRSTTGRRWRRTPGSRRTRSTTPRPATPSGPTLIADALGGPDPRRRLPLGRRPARSGEIHGQMGGRSRGSIPGTPDTDDRFRGDAGRCPASRHRRRLVPCLDRFPRRRRT